jgi:hypothetical protein
MKTLQLTFPAVGDGGRVLTLSARFLGLDHDDGADDDLPSTVSTLITCDNRVFEPTEDGAYRARGGATLLRARDARYDWPRLRRLAELALDQAD